MPAKLINGKAFADSIKNDIQKKITEKINNHQRPPGLAVILIGDDPASTIYVTNKRKACQQVGIHSFYHHLSPDITDNELIDLIKQLNEDASVDGILLQLPLPAHLNADRIIELIHPHKDVDGFSAYNLGRLALRRPLLRPCTSYGVMLLLDNINQLYKGKHAVILGASNIVGRPMALELLSAGSTITICHRFTTDLPYYVKQADILISAVGKPKIIKGDWIKEGATVIDIGITRLPDGKICGDIDFEAAKQKAAWITPVPGGVGPMTVAVLLQNTLFAADNRGKMREELL